MIASVRRLLKGAVASSGILVSVFLVLALVLYLLGITQLFFVATILFMAISFPFPKICRSFFSRALVSVLIFYSLFQLVVTMNFILIPSAQFKVTAIFMTVIVLVAAQLTKAVPTQKQRKMIISKQDLYALITAAIFVIPLVVYCFGPNGVFHSASIGSIQGIDGTNHSATIADTGSDQRLTYTKGSNYPAGFHLATAFVQKSVSVSQGSLGWVAAERLYILQYLLLAVALGFILFLLTKQLIYLLSGSFVTANLALSLSLGSALSIFYLFPFLYNGFLSYFYIIATMACALIYLAEFAKIKQDTKNSLGLASGGVVFLLGYFVLAFGAMSSWALLAPPLIATGCMAIYPDRIKDLFKKSVYASKEFWLVILAVLVSLIPVYIQIAYAGSSSTVSGINATGALKLFSAGLYIAGLVLVAVLVLNQALNERMRDFLNSVATPLYIFVGILAAYQMFTEGEIRYYVIKTAIWLEIFILVLVCALIFNVFTNLMGSKPRYIWLIIAAPTLLFFSLFALNGNPIKDTRSLFRTYSNEAKPQYFDQDVEKFSQLGKAGAIDRFNGTLLHYQSDSGKFFAHMQIPTWANGMLYTPSHGVTEAENCNARIYENQLFGVFSESDQEALIKLINRCVQIARSNSRIYYIVTDEASAPFIASKFGNPQVKVVW